MQNVCRYFGGFLTQMLTQPPLQRRELKRPVCRAAGTAISVGSAEILLCQIGSSQGSLNTLWGFSCPSQTHFSVTQLQCGL